MKDNLVKDLLKKHRAKIVVLLSMAVLLVLMGVGVVEFGRRIINTLSDATMDSSEKYRLIVTNATLMLIIALSCGALNYLLNKNYNRFSQSFVGELRATLFSHLLKLPQEFYNKNAVGHITSRLTNEVGYIGNFFAKLFLQPVISSVMVLFYGIYIYWLDWKMAIAGTIFIPLTIVVIPRFNRTIQVLTEQNVNYNGALSSYLQEAFTGISDIRSNQTYSYEESRLKKRLSDCIQVSLDLGSTYGGLESINKIINQLAPLALYVFGGILCIKGEMTVGSLVAAIAVINSLYNPVSSLVNFTLEWKQVKVRFNKLEEYLRLEPEAGISPQDDRSSVTGNDIDIRFDNVQFGFSGEELLLNNISFQTDYGKKAAFVGTSGSGKSLSVSLINSVYKPLSGKISFGNKESDSIGLYKLRSMIGYVNQAPFLFNDTIKNNIMYSLFRKQCSSDDIAESWVDLSLTKGIEDMKALDDRLLAVIKDVGLYEDILRLGLKSRFDGTAAAHDDTTRDLVLKARGKFNARVDDDGRFMEFYQEECFLEYCTLLENIVFMPAASVNVVNGSPNAFYRDELLEPLKANGLLEVLFEIGLHLAESDRALIEKLYNEKSPLMSNLQLSDAMIERKLMINKSLPVTNVNLDSLSRNHDDLVLEILDLAFNHVPGNSKEDLVDEETKSAILRCRKVFMGHLSHKFGGKIQHFRQDEYMDSLTVMENIVFGNIDPLRKRASERTYELIKEILISERLEDSVLRLGLEFNVGERGGKLSGGQKQKVAIARILLKNPSILILDEATAALDSASQSRITDLVREQYRDKTVISIAHRLNIIKDYDEILVFDKGRIVQKGTFDQLVDADGLFKKLYEGSI